MYYQGEVEKSDRRKIITIATAVIVVVLILVVAIIVVATRKTSTENIGGDDNASFAIDENKEEKQEENKNEENKDESENKSEEKTDTPIIISTKPATSTNEVAASVPTTGPADALPMALGLGSLTTAATAYVMSRKKI